MTSDVHNPEGTRTVAELFVDLLARSGVTDVFGVAGSTIMPLLDALAERRDVTYHAARHEQSATDMASGYARAANRLGVCMVHVGPGATSTVTALTGAFRDHVPLLLITGNEESATLVREPYHDWRSERVLSAITAASHRVTRPDDLPHIVRQALGRALRTVPGPVHVDLPEDVALEEIDAARYAQLVDASAGWCRQFAASVGSLNPVAAPAGSLRAALDVVLAARRPVVVLGEFVHWSAAAKRAVQFCERVQAPFVTTFGARGGVPDSELYRGTIGRFGTDLANRILTDADAVLGLGAAFTDVDTVKWTLLPPGASLVLVHPDPALIDLRLDSTLGVVADVGAFIDDALQLLATGAADLDARRPWHTQAISTGDRAEATQLDAHAVRSLIESLPDSWALSMDPGFAALSLSADAHLGGTRFLYPYGFGCMGFAVPNAAGAVLSGRVQGAMAVIGDGSFFMSMASVESLASLDLPVTVVVIDDGGFGSQRQKQREGYAGRTMGVDYDNPDIAAVGAALGLRSRRLDRPADVADECARIGGETAGPALLVVTRDRDQHTPWYEGTKKRR